MCIFRHVYSIEMSLRRWALLLTVVWLATPAVRLGCAWSCAAVAAAPMHHSAALSCHDAATTPAPRLSGGERCVDQPLASRTSLGPAKQTSDELAYQVAALSAPQSRVPTRALGGPIAEASPPDRPPLTALRL